MTQIQKILFEMKDEGYADFHSKLVPTVNRQKIIGVRVPDCRKLAKEVKNSNEVGEFLSSLPHEYYDEDIYTLCS